MLMFGVYIVNGRAHTHTRTHTHTHMQAHCLGPTDALHCVLIIFILEFFPFKISFRSKGTFIHFIFYYIYFLEGSIIILSEINN